MKKKSSIPNEEYLVLEKYSSNYIASVKLGNGWEVLDLSSHLNLWVTLKTGQRFDLDFISVKFLEFNFKKYGYYISKCEIILDSITIKRIIEAIDGLTELELQRIADYWQKFCQ
jgi:hypothetical protein